MEDLLYNDLAFLTGEGVESLGLKYVAPELTEGFSGALSGARMRFINWLTSQFNPCKCFVAGTLVRTKDGFKPIEKVEVGDLVVARDEKTGDTALKPVIRLIRNGEKNVVRVVYIDTKGKREMLGVTPEHPFMLDGLRWVPAGQLKSGDKIVGIDGGLLTVSKVTKYAARHHTYNFDSSEFFVGS